MTTGGLIGGIYQPLTDQEIEIIHQKALDILEQIGIGYEDDLEALEMLDKAGCQIDSQARKIFMPRDLVIKMVNKAPGAILVYPARQELTVAPLARPMLIRPARRRICPG